MLVRRCADATEFLGRSEAFLLEHEAEHNLIVGLSSGLRHGERSEHPPYLAVVEDGRVVVLAALRTLPRNLIVSRCDDPRAMDLLISDLSKSLCALPGVAGPAAVAGAFAVRWRALTGGSSALAMAQRIYELSEVVPVAGVPGVLRPIRDEDSRLLLDWFDDFVTCERGIGHEDAVRALERFLTADHVVRGLYLWEVGGEPVSMVGHSGPTPNGMRVGPVYTPPQARRRGFASAAVAALSQRLLDSGRKFCYLHTDLANPTSNHIYQTIGYRPVSYADQYRFAME